MTLASVLLLILIGFAAGIFGALAGVGGGIIVTPLLAIYFGLPMHQAIGVTLLCVIATSTATSSLYVERHVTRTAASISGICRNTQPIPLQAFSTWTKGNACLRAGRLAEFILLHSITAKIRTASADERRRRDLDIGNGKLAVLGIGADSRREHRRHYDGACIGGDGSHGCPP